MMTPIEFSTSSPPSPCAKDSRISNTPSQAEHKFDQLSIGVIETIDLTGQAAIPSSSTTDPCEQPQPHNGDAISCQSCGKRGKKRKSDGCTPDSLAASQYPSAVGPLTIVHLSPLSSKSLAKLPAITSRHTPHRDTKLSKRTIVNNDRDDYSSDGWLDVDTIFSDAELELSPLSSRRNSRGDGSKEATGQSNSKLFSKDEEQPLRSVAKNSDSRQLQNSESLAEVSPVQQAVSSFIDFMAIDLEAVAQLISILKEKLHNNAEVIYQQAIGGPPDSGLIAANKNLVSQIQALESLQTSRITYQKCATRKEDLKQSLVRAISEGSDPTSMPELARSQDLETEMRKIEAQIRELLPRAGVFDVACNHVT